MLINSLAAQDAQLIVALKIRKLRKLISEQAALVEELRTDLIKKHGTPNADGKTVTLSEDGVKAINELLYLDNDFKCDQITVEDIGNMTVKAALLEQAAWLIKE
jgi:hypothetical protein